MHAAEPQASCRTHPSRSWWCIRGCTTSPDAYSRASQSSLMPHTHIHPSIHPSSPRAQVERAGIDGSLVDDVIVGCVSQTGAQAGNIGRNMVLASVKAKPRSITHPSPLPSPLLHLTVTRCAQLVTRNAASVVACVAFVSHHLQQKKNITQDSQYTYKCVCTGCCMPLATRTRTCTHNAQQSKIPESVPGTSVDRQCGSSQQAIHFAAQAVMSGVQDVVIAAGVENMSQVPIGSNIGDAFKVITPAS
jgi:acetyl-CoA acetyltransferase